MHIKRFHGCDKIHRHAIPDGHGAKAGCGIAFLLPEVLAEVEYDRLISAIRAVADGGTAFSPEIETMLKKEPRPPTLTERQRQILEHTVNGLSADQISKRMNLSSFTVNEHLDAIKRKLGSVNRPSCGRHYHASRSPPHARTAPAR